MPLAPKGNKRGPLTGLATAAALAFSAVAPSASEPLRTPVLETGESWWYSQNLNSVLAIRPCPQRQLCARVVWYAPHDRRLSDIFNPANRNTTPINMCNFEFPANFERKNPNRWDGRMRVAERNWNVDTRIEAVNPNSLRLRASVYIVATRTENLTRVPVGDTRYTTCRPYL